MAEDQSASLAAQIRAIVREELHAFHVKPQRRWYEREPFRGVAAHVITAIVAVSVGYSLHILTGAPINIEVATSKSEKALEVTASAPVPTALANFTLIFEDASVTACASPSVEVAVVPPKQVPKKTQRLAAGTLSVPATAAAPAAAPIPASTPPSEIDNADTK